MNDNFNKSFDLVLGHEGGFSDDPRDKGNWLPDGRKGCTNLGVTQTTWEMFVGRKSDATEMKALTREKVRPLYKKLFWDKCRCDDLSDGVDYLVYDFAVNAGPGASAKILQRAVGTTQDGQIGNMTVAAAQRFDAEDLVKRFSQSKRDFYISLNNPVYQQGWLNRVRDVEKTALGMIA